MGYKKTLLTGATGELGRAIVKSEYFSSLSAPSRERLDITNLRSVENFFEKNDFDAIIHCAAMARMKKCEENPEEAVITNIVGTGNIIASTISLEKRKKKKIKFIQISTDGVYPGTRGNYSEKDETIPYNKYGWTKLGAECAVRILSNHCIIRTNFFDPEDIKFDNAATDAFSSKVPISYLVKSISTLLNCGFVGTVNVGRKRKSDYEHYAEFKPDIRKCKLSHIQKNVPFALYKDCSMDISLWEKIEKKNE